MLKATIFTTILLLGIYSHGIAQKVNRALFFSVCEQKYPAYKLNKNKKKHIEIVFDYWERSDYTDLRWLAYILGTIYRETAGTMHPVREGLCDTDECSIKAVTALFDKKKITRNYALPDEYGRSYFGRGYVQLTLKDNYQRVGKALGWKSDLVEHPELALESKKATAILVEGMVKGMFTKKKAKLSDYFNDTVTDWVNARKIVNPKSHRAEITAGHSRDFYACLTAK